MAITGASGFIGLHCVLALLRDGYRVRGTLRDLAREASLRQALAKHVEIGDRLEFVSAEFGNGLFATQAIKGNADLFFC